MRHADHQTQTPAWRKPCGEPVVGARKQVVTIALLEAALEEVAVALIDDDVYLPVFVRLEAELDHARETETTRERARAIARRARSRNASR